MAEIIDSGDGGSEWTFEVDPGLERYLVEKGSVTLDGISLTVVEPEGRRFRVALIPKTLEVTNLGSAGVGTAGERRGGSVGEVDRAVAGGSGLSRGGVGGGRGFGSFDRSRAELRGRARAQRCVG